MNIQIFELIDGAKAAKGLTVIIDVFRAMTVEAYVIRNGAADLIPIGSVTISLSGLAVAALVGIFMNAVLPGKDYEFGTNVQGDTAVNFGARND